MERCRYIHMKATVLYFSPTGGTERVAQLIAGELKAQALDITVFDYDLSYGEDEVIFFCFPVYGGRIPKPMYKRMQGIRGARTPAVLVAVYGNRAVEDALMEMSDLAREKGFRTVGGAEMIAPHSIDRRFGAGRPDESDTAKLMDFLHKLEAKETLGVVAMPGSHDYRKYDGLPLRPVSGKDCSGCGTCAQECPTGAIDGGDPMKPDPAKCISCMRCVSVCPFEVRHVPKALLAAASASLRIVCSSRKEPKFYI